MSPVQINRLVGTFAKNPRTLDAYCTACMMPQGTTVNMAPMIRSERLRPENIEISLIALHGI